MHGRCHPQFETVRSAFAQNFAEGREDGASVALMHRGELVVDLWAASAGARPWDRDTLVTVFSATKGAASLAVAMLVDRGLLDYDQPVARYWPEFGQAGKESISVAQLMSHQAGLPVIDPELPENAAADWELMVKALERQRPIWTPGTRAGYHAVTFAWLVGELVRRACGVRIGRFVRETIADPLGLDFWIGTPESEQHRITPVIPKPPPAELARPSSLFVRAMALGSPPLAPPLDTASARALELASTNGCTNARSLATMYGTLALGGGALITPATLTCASAERWAGIDAVTGMACRYACGFQLPVPGGRYSWSDNPRAFGHTGAGGSLGFADPDAGFGFGYTMTRILPTAGADPRWQRLVQAVRQAIGSDPRRSRR